MSYKGQTFYYQKMKERTCYRSLVEGDYTKMGSEKCLLILGWDPKVLVVFGWH